MLSSTFCVLIRKKIENKTLKRLFGIYNVNYKRINMEWTNVKDKLPDSDSYLILYDQRLGCWPGHFEDGKWIYFFYANECNARANHVTHWMPLPELPKENK